MARWRKILVPTDFSEGARLALVEALDLAKQYGARVDVLHVAPIAPKYIAGGIVPEAYAADLGQREKAEKHLARWLKRTRRAGGLDARIVIGEAARDIVQALTNGRYDLVVMGTHGRTGLSRALMGSVAESVLRHAPCPVLTVRMHESRRAKRAAAS